MLRLFKRKQKVDSPVASYWQQLGRAITRRQRQCADYLNEKTRHASPRRIKVGLFVFIGVFGGTSVLTLFSSLSPSTTLRAPDKIRIPRHILDERDTPVPPAGLSESTRRNLEAFHRYMDSLGKSPSGRRIYDSIMVVRPGLLDSVRHAKQLYEHH